MYNIDIRNPYNISNKKYNKWDYHINPCPIVPNPFNGIDWMQQYVERVL